MTNVAGVRTYLCSYFWQVLSQDVHFLMSNLNGKILSETKWPYANNNNIQCFLFVRVYKKWRGKKGIVSYGIKAFCLVVAL